MLDPVQRSFSQFRCWLLHRWNKFNPIQFLSGEPLSELPSSNMQWPHPTAPALLAKESGLPRRVERRLCAERRPARSASVKLRQPAAEPHGPKCEITQRQLPGARALNLPNRQQKKPEHGLRRFMFGKNLL